MENKYELVLILKSTISEEEQKKILGGINKFIQDVGKINKTENLGKKVLAYLINKEKEGFYYLLDFEIPTKEVAKLGKKLKLDGAIIRHLLIRRI